MPTIQVLDEAIVPEIGMGRGTAKKGILAGIATMMLGMFVAFGREYVAGVRSAKPFKVLMPGLTLSEASELKY